MMIPWNKPDLGATEQAYVMEALNSSWISGGAFVDRLEKGLQDFLGCEDVVTVSSGTAALHLAYLTLGIGPGDEILLPGFTFQAAANMALAVGAKPIFIDVDKDTWMMDPSLIERAITKKTKAIVVVHLYGYVANLDAIAAIAERNNLTLIEDAAEALFSKYRGRYVGTLTSIGCLSFQSTKTITTGEGGAVLFNSSKYTQLARLYRNHGMRPERKYWHEVAGHNFRLTNLQAAVGLAQLERADKIIESRKRIAQTYKKFLQGLEFAIDEQLEEKNSEPLLWALAIRIKAANRETCISALAEKGIETRPGFVSADQMPLYECQPLKVSRQLSDQVLSLPTFAQLSNEEIEFICRELSSVLHRQGQNPNAL